MLTPTQLDDVNAKRRKRGLSALSRSQAEYALRSRTGSQDQSAYLMNVTAAALVGMGTVGNTGAEAFQSSTPTTPPADAPASGGGDFGGGGSSGDFSGGSST